MEKTNRFSLMRLTYVVIMAAIFVIGTVALAYFSNMLYDQLLCICCLDVCYFLIFILYLIHNRLNNLLPEKTYVSYAKICIITFLNWVIFIICMLYATDFFAPVMLFTLLGSVVLSDGLNIISGCYFVILLSIAQNFNIYIMICYILLVIFGCLIASFMNGKDSMERLCAFVLIMALNAFIPIIFYYFSFLEINVELLYSGLIEGIIICIISGVVNPLFLKTIKQTNDFIYDELLDEDYDLCVDIRRYSYIEYQHAKRVSRLSKLCASKIGANEKLCLAAGFYYRIGKMEGEPMIDNAIKLANDHCFPTDLITILSEYGGIMALPSSKESAIVHMVDSVVTKVELFDADAMTSSWNQNMVIYQTINELSQKGLYDESGLSMNQFLIIRECLAKEDILK